jgi:hypothetical protein
MRNDTAYQVQLEMTTLPSTTEEQQQFHNDNFNYRQAIGEAIYAMTVTRRRLRLRNYSSGCSLQGPPMA